MSEKKYSQGDLVEVRFYDIFSENEWTDIRKAMVKDPPICKVKGHFLNEDGVCIRLGLLICDDGDITYILIPKGLIISTRVVEEDEIFDFKEDV